MLEEKVLNDYKEAMKSRDSVKSGILSFLRAQFMNLAVEKKKNNLDDGECLVVIKKLVKQHQDSIDQFKAGGRQDLVDKEVREMGILKAYLPAELSAEEIKKVVEEAVNLTSASGIKDMGKVMKEAMAKLAGQADNKTVSDLVKERLSR